MTRTPFEHSVRRDPEPARTAYYRAIEAARPNESERAWRRSRFERGLRLVAELERVHFPTIENLEILDMGMAFGADCSSLTSQGARMTGLDSIDLGMKALRDEFRDLGPIRTLRAELNAPLALDAESFDGAIAMDSLSHVVRLDDFFSECRRILRPRGWLLATTPLAFRWILGDAHYGVPGISLLPVKTQRYVAEDLLGRRYRYQIAGPTLYSVRGLARPAARHGFSCRGFIYANRQFTKTLDRIPGGGLAHGLIRLFAPDYIFFTRT